MTTPQPDDRASHPHPGRSVVVFAVVAFVILFVLGALAVWYVVLSNYRHDEELHRQRPGAMQTEKPGAIARSALGSEPNASPQAVVDELTPMRADGPSHAAISPGPPACA